MGRLGVGGEDGPYRIVHGAQPHLLNHVLAVLIPPPMHLSLCKGANAE